MEKRKIKLGRNNLKYAKKVLTRKPSRIIRLGKKVRNNLEFALEVLEKEPKHIQALGDDIRNNFKFAEKVFEKNPSYIEDLGEDIRNNFKFAEKVLEEPSYIQYLGDDIRNNSEFAEKILEKELYHIIDDLGEDVRNNLEFAERVLEKAPPFLYRLGRDVLNNIEFAEKILEKSPNYIRDLGKDVLNNIEFAEKVLEKFPKYIRVLGEDIRNNLEITLKIADKVLEDESVDLTVFGEDVRNNLEFAEKILEKVPNLYHITLLGKDVLSNLEFIGKVLEKEPGCIQYLGEDVKNNPEIALKILEESPECIKDLGEDVRNSFWFVEKVLEKTPDYRLSLGREIYLNNREMLTDVVYKELLERFKQKYNDYNDKEIEELKNKDKTGLELIALYNSSIADDNLKNEIQRKLFDKIKVSKDEIREENLKYVVQQVLNGKRRVESLENIVSEDTYRYVRYLGDVITFNEKEFILRTPENFIKNTNTKRYEPILKRLQNYDVSNSVEIAYQMLYTIGEEKSLDLLDGKYGNINNKQIVEMFSEVDVKSLEFEKTKRGYLTVLNEDAVRMVFGNSVEEENTPIKNFLNSNSSDAEKKLITKFHRLINEWPIIEEEFIRKQNLHKLSGQTIRKTPEAINEVLDSIEIANQGLEEIDYKLKTSKVLKYIPDTKYTKANIKTITNRVMELSKLQEKVLGKHFPNIVEENEKYALSILGPQDRDILALGHETNCCFRSCGVSDNSGLNNKSLLAYCATTEYGGGITLVEKETGEVVMGSPILRNGNILMIHSIETKGMNQEEKTVAHEMLKSWSNKMIKETTKKENEDEKGIKAVAITDLHNLDTTYIEGTLTENRFNVFTDEMNEFKGYSNLDKNHHILAIKKGVKEKDLEQGIPIEKLYEYPEDVKTKSINLKDIESVHRLIEMKALIASLSKRREEELKYNFGKADETLKTIKESQRNFLKRFKRDSFKYDSYIGMQEITNYFNEVIEGKQVENKSTKDVIQVTYGNNWYVAKVKDGKSEDLKLTCNYPDNLLESSKEKIRKVLEKEERLLTGREIKVNIEDYKLTNKERSELSNEEKENENER